MIRLWSRVVRVLVVGIELNVLASCKKATREEVRCTPFRVLALVEELGAGVHPRMVGANRQAPLACESVSIRPAETAVRPVKVPAVLVRQQNGRGKRDVKQDNRLQTVDGGLQRYPMVNTTGMGFMSSMSKMVIRLSFSSGRMLNCRLGPT